MNDELSVAISSEPASAVPSEAPSWSSFLKEPTDLGASLGTALAGSLLIATLSSSFMANIAQNPAIPPEINVKAQVELAGGVPFVSDAGLEAALDERRADPETTDEALDAYAEARWTGSARRS